MRFVSEVSVLSVLFVMEICFSDAAFVSPVVVSFTVETRNSSSHRPQLRSVRRNSKTTPPDTSAEADPSRRITPSPIYDLLATPNESRPGCETFFYNDEVISHLHGYILLVGLFAASDELFLGSFLVFAATAAAATLAGYLPANPRVPAVVAVATLLTTLALRFPLGYEYRFSDGPSEQAVYYEALICVLNVAWGLAGHWRTKEKRNGATFGF